MAYRAPDGNLYPSEEWYNQQVAQQQAGGPSSFGIGSKAEAKQPDAFKDTGDLNAGNLNENANFKLEELGGTTPNVDGGKSYLEQQQTLIDSLMKENEERKKQYELDRKEAKEQQEKTQSLLDKFLNKPTTSDVSKQTYEDLGIKPADYFTERKADIAGVQSLMNSYDAKVVAKETEIARIESQPLIEGIVNTQKIAAEKKYNIELNQMSAGINTKLAVMAMKQGKFNEAQDFVNQAVEDYTFDLNLEYEQLINFQEQNDDLLADLGAKYRDTLATSTDLAREARDVERARVMQTAGGFTEAIDLSQ